MGRNDSEGASGDESVNEVRLVGRLANEPEARVLPSGDELVSFRLVVDRSARARAGAGRVRVDTLDCAVWRADVRRRVMGLAPGTRLEVSGALRRRFWRGAGGPASRVEVEVERLRRVRARE